MYFNLGQIEKSLAVLEKVHPFYGITYLVCKRAQLPIGISFPFPMSSQETEFLNEFYKPDSSSNYYHRVFRVSEKSKRWIHHEKYASSTLQSTRTQSVFKNAFLHDSNTGEWGWARDYVKVLRSNLAKNSPPQKGRRIPAFHLAVWLYRNRDWPRTTTAQDIVIVFLVDFAIDPEERDQIFDLSTPSISTEDIFGDEALSWKELRRIIGSPPDSKPEEGATIQFLELHEIGPATNLRYEPAERLNLITGDNSLGKTLLLECIWWSLTGEWIEYPAMPRKDVPKNKPRIAFSISASGDRSHEFESSFIWDRQQWKKPWKRDALPGLVIYARYDGSIAVWDPARSSMMDQDLGVLGRRQAKHLFFKRRDIWDGLVVRDGQPEQQWLCNGLIRDWITWQTGGESYREHHEALVACLRILSPSGLELLSLGEPSKVFIGDSRDFPTLRMPYGEDVPIVFASAAIRRIISVAYVMVWAWQQHLASSRIIRRRPQRRLVLLVDEVEAHLHPRWQRIIIAALMGAVSKLDSSVSPQLHIATHSPMVMASAETVFHESVDALHHLALTGDGVVLNQLPFVRRGRADLWLMSDAFGLAEPRSLPAEEAIGSARGLQLSADPDSVGVMDVNAKLVKYLAPDDDFWPEWRYFAKQHGVK